jgi:hypothetical protein
VLSRWRKTLGKTEWECVRLRRNENVWGWEGMRVCEVQKEWECEVEKDWECVRLRCLIIWCTVKWRRRMETQFEGKVKLRFSLSHHQQLALTQHFVSWGTVCAHGEVAAVPRAVPTVLANIRLPPHSNFILCTGTNWGIYVTSRSSGFGTLSLNLRQTKGLLS